MKIAIVGGTFDPVHDGHLEMGRAALKYLNADEVWFMPAKLTPLKDHAITDSQDRLNMLELALKEEPGMKVCTLELDREGRSYTIDTVRQLKELYPQDEFVWLIGADQLARFDQWKDADELVRLIDFACFKRENLKLKSRYPIQYVPMEPRDVSSTEIRQGRKLEHLNPAVLEYIYRHRLYIYEFVSSRMSQKRYNHSLMVAGLCQAIAAANGLDPDKAYLTGLFHDITKYMPFEKGAAAMRRLALDPEAYPAPTWHGFTGAAYVKEKLLLNDEDIYEAIYYHVFGDSDNPYAMIVFCADKLDPLRPYDSSAMLNLCMYDLPAGFEMVKEQNRQYLKENKNR